MAIHSGNLQGAEAEDCGSRCGVHCQSTTVHQLVFTSDTVSIYCMWTYTIDGKVKEQQSSAITSSLLSLYKHHPPEARGEFMR